MSGVMSRVLTKEFSPIGIVGPGGALRLIGFLFCNSGTEHAAVCIELRINPEDRALMVLDYTVFAQRARTLLFDGNSDTAACDDICLPMILLPGMEIWAMASREGVHVITSMEDAK